MQAYPQQAGPGESDQGADEVVLGQEEAEPAEAPDPAGEDGQGRGGCCGERVGRSGCREEGRGGTCLSLPEPAGRSWNLWGIAAEEVLGQ